MDVVSNFLKRIYKICRNRLMMRHEAELREERVLADAQRTAQYSSSPRFLSLNGLK